MVLSMSYSLGKLINLNAQLLLKKCYFRLGRQPRNELNVQNQSGIIAE